MPQQAALMPACGMHNRYLYHRYIYIYLKFFVIVQKPVLHGYIFLRLHN